MRKNVFEGELVAVDFSPLRHDQRAGEVGLIVMWPTCRIRAGMRVIVTDKVDHEPGSFEAAIREEIDNLERETK